MQISRKYNRFSKKIIKRYCIEYGEKQKKKLQRIFKEASASKASLKTSRNIKTFIIVKKYISNTSKYILDTAKQVDSFKKLQKNLMEYNRI